MSLTVGQPNFARSLAVSWAGTLYIHFWGLLPPDGILPRAKFTLCPSLALSYIGSVTARHSSSGRLPNFAVWYKEWNYGTYAEGATYIRLGRHHVGHRPTFYFYVYHYLNVLHWWWKKIGFRESVIGILLMWLCSIPIAFSALKLLVSHKIVFWQSLRLSMVIFCD